MILLAPLLSSLLLASSLTLLSLLSYLSVFINPPHHLCTKPHITFHHITFHHITLHHITSHSITSLSITKHCSTSHHIPSHSITSHCTTLHHIPSHSITSHTTQLTTLLNITGCNACRGSPNSAPSAINVGATDIKDSVSYFSDIGTYGRTYTHTQISYTLFLEYAVLYHIPLSAIMITT